METSAKNNINIDRAFHELAEAILNKTHSRPDPHELPVRIKPTNPSPGNPNSPGVISRCC